MNKAVQHIDFFPTRDRAKTALEYIPGGKFKDYGTGSPKGERWAIISKQVADHNTDKSVTTVDLTETVTEVATVDLTKVVTEVNAEIPKTDITRNILTELYGQEGVRPRDIIQRIMAECDFNQRAASTYYYNAKRDLKLK